MMVQITGKQDGSNAAAIASTKPLTRTESALADGLFNTFDIGDTLTANDKKLVGWEPNSGKINSAAIALASYRNSGAITGEISQDFANTLKSSISNGGRYPMNPSNLMAKGAQQDRLSSDTYTALFDLLNQTQTGAVSGKVDL
jgi:hypothetical protein